MTEQFTIDFNPTSRVTIAKCLGCGASIELDYSEHAHKTSDAAIQFGREHALCEVRKHVEEASREVRG